jgi:rhamnosyltransferase subunit B
VTVIGGALYPSVFGEESDPRHVENPQERQYSDLPLIVPVNRARTRLGLPLVRTYSDLFTCLASFNALLFSQWFGEKEAHWPSNTIPGEFIFQEVIGSSGFTKELEEFLASPDKPILCTFGTGNLHCQEYFEHALNAIQRANRRAIFICKDRNNLPKDLPESVLWLEYCNDFPALLQRCSLIVHHGGIGTLAESARAGIPQLITPSLGDQWDNAARIKNLQLGSNIPAPALNSENFYQAITEILQSAAINKNCADLGKQIKNRLSPRDIANNIVQTLIHAKVLES